MTIDICWTRRPREHDRDRDGRRTLLRLPPQHEYLVKVPLSDVVATGERSGKPIE